MRKGAKELLLFSFKCSRAVWSVGQLQDSQELQTVETSPEGSMSRAKGRAFSAKVHCGGDLSRKKIEQVNVLSVKGVVDVLRGLLAGTPVGDGQLMMVLLRKSQTTIRPSPRGVSGGGSATASGRATDDSPQGEGVGP